MTDDERQQKVVLYMAISADGLIADNDDRTPWSDDEWQAFTEFAQSCDVVILGKKTYQIMKADGDFVTGPKYFVATHDNNFDTGKFAKVIIKSRDDLPKARRIGIIGGSELNASLAQLDLIDEVILDVEPIVLGEGKHLFAELVHMRLALVSSRIIGQNTVQNTYTVLR